MIRDLETLRLTVLDEASREFITEALRCYNAGAFRAAVAVAVAAGMDDLRRKLGAVVAAKAAGVDPSVVTGYAAVDKTFQEQQAFEAQLIDVAEKATMVAPAEAAKLRVLLKTRHLCAHPSGHAGSAEEARECIASMIDLVLARPPLMGIAAVLLLLERLNGPNFFPSADQAKCDAVVQAELAVLMPAGFMALASKLTDKIKSATQAHAAAKAGAKIFQYVPRTSEHENSVRFARGMLRSGAQARAAIWFYMGKVIEEQTAVADALLLLAGDPTGLAGAQALTRERAVALVRRHLDQKEAREALRGMRQAGVLAPEETDEMAQQAARLFINSRPHQHLEAMKQLEWPQLEIAWRDSIVAASGSSTWDEANPAIDLVQGMDSASASAFSLEQRTEYVLGVAHYAQGTYAPNSARPMLTQGLKARVDFVDSLMGFFNAKPESARQSKTDWEAVARILLASNRPDAVECIFTLFETANELPYSIRQMLDRLEAEAPPELKAKATALRAKIPKLIPNT